MSGECKRRRAELFDASTLLQTAALDPYEFVREAYLQSRRSPGVSRVAQAGPVSKPNQRPTEFSQDAEVGVKCTWNRGCPASHPLTAGILCAP